MDSSFKEIVNFIRKLYNKPEGFIPLHAPVFNGNEKKYLNECIDSTFVSSVGKFVDQFELKIAEYAGAKYAIVCVNGTSALHMALQLVGVERDDEVITQSLTFIATANAISYCGAHPIFLDVDRWTMGLSPDSVKQWLMQNAEMKNDFCYNRDTGRRIKACVPMHTFGHPVRMEELLEVCEEYCIEVVEDAAESLGSFYNSKHTGTFGKIGVLSFNGNKIITTGGGGMLLIQDEALAKKAKHLTMQAKIQHPWESTHDEIGHNYRMPNINAALGVAQLEQLNQFLKSKRAIAEKYELFFNNTDVKFVTEPEFASSNYWLNCILLPDKKERDIFLKYMTENGIMARPAWQLMNKLSMFTNCQTDALINAQNIAETLVSVPSSAFDEK